MMGQVADGLLSATAAAGGGGSGGGSGGDTKGGVTKRAPATKGGTGKKPRGSRET
jgi:hypothetical protein